jgi:hypothetical protein
MLDWEHSVCNWSYLTLRARQVRQPAYVTIMAPKSMSKERLTKA